jgi:hypothetical protein
VPLGLLARDLNAAGDISDDCLSFVIDVNVFNSNELRSTVFQLAEYLHLSRERSSQEERKT